MILYNNVFCGSATKEIIKISVADLKTLKNESKLDTNVVYQITDFVDGDFKAEITQNVNVETQTNYFDLLVTALNDNTLSCNVGATKHDGIDYYTEEELSSYKIIYFIDEQSVPMQYKSVNDYCVLYDFYSPSNNKGYILSLTDQLNNTANYNFKNVKINGYYLFDRNDGYGFSDTSIWSQNSTITPSSNNYIHLNFNLLNITYTPQRFGAYMNNCKIINSYIGANEIKNANIYNSYIDGCDQIRGSILEIENSDFNHVFVYTNRQISIKSSKIRQSDSLKKITLKGSIIYSNLKNFADNTTINSSLINTHLNGTNTIDITVESTGYDHYTYIQPKDNVTTITA